MTEKTVLGWHFLPADMRLGNGDSRLAVDGETLEVAGPVKICKRGLHASRRLIDALELAQGPVICRVEVSGEIVEESDKLVGLRRRMLWHLDAQTSTDILWRFARKCALDAIGDSGAIERIYGWNVPRITRRYLETGDESIRDAARDAARNVACYAFGPAEIAARDAVYEAMLPADWEFAGTTARFAASAAAWGVRGGNMRRDAAWYASKKRIQDAQNRTLTAMVHAIHGDERKRHHEPKKRVSWLNRIFTATGLIKNG